MSIFLPKTEMSKKQQKKTGAENNVITRTEQIHGAVILAYTVLALEKNFGKLAIGVALIPYVMLHFHKPPLEAVGAIFAGLILGVVSQRTCSILVGVFVHVGVAATMDFLALNRF